MRSEEKQVECSSVGFVGVKKRCRNSEFHSLDIEEDYEPGKYTDEQLVDMGVKVIKENTRAFDLTRRQPFVTVRPMKLSYEKGQINYAIRSFCLTDYRTIPIPLEKFK